MNKTKITLLAIGGVSILGALVFGYLIYSAWSDKGAKDEELGYLEDDAARLSGLEVYPSQEGVKALKDCGIKLMECSIGPRYAFDGKEERLPYGHAFRLLQNRKPETGFYWRESRNTAISATICAYNHISEEQSRQTAHRLDYLHDPDTGMNFHHMFCDAPCLNLCTLETLKEDIAKCIGGEYLIFSNLEQSFFKDYLAYQPEYADKIRLMCKTMHENGYSFMLMQDLA